MVKPGDSRRLNCDRVCTTSATAATMMTMVTMMRNAARNELPGLSDGWIQQPIIQQKWMPFAVSKTPGHVYAGNPLKERVSTWNSLSSQTYPPDVAKIKVCQKFIGSLLSLPKHTSFVKQKPTATPPHPLSPILLNERLGRCSMMILHFVHHHKSEFLPLSLAVC